MKQDQPQSFYRWWEFYAIRYAMGSIVGAVVFFSLCLTNPILKKHLLFGADVANISPTQLTLLVGYGVTFCYIASAPILVFHVGRYLIDINQKSLLSLKRFAWGVIPPLVFAIICWFVISSASGRRELDSLVAFLALLVIWPQYLIIFHTLFKSEKLFEFYKELARKRDISSASLVESYRHMREHGNSFSIVILELILGLILFCFGNIDAWLGKSGLHDPSAYVLPYIWVILAWILPASLIWLVGTVLERRVRDD